MTTTPCSENIVQAALDDLRFGQPEEGLQAIERCFRGRLLGFFRRRNASTETCEDLSQETLLKVFCHIASFQGAARSFPAWLFRIASNVFYRHVRRRGGPEISLLEEDEIIDETPESDPLVRTLQDERIQLLKEAIETLPPRCQEILILKLYHGLNGADIADVLRISSGAVRAQLHIAKQRLTQLLCPTENC